MKKKLAVILSLMLMLNMMSACFVYADTASEMDSAKAARDKAAAELQESETALTEANKKVDEAQAAYDAAAAKNPDAVKALEEAEKKQADAEAALESAQAEHESAVINAEKASAEATAAKEERNTALKEYNSAKENADAKEKEVIDASKAYEEAQAEFDKTVAAMADDPDVAAASQALDEAKAATAEAEQSRDAAADAVQKADEDLQMAQSEKEINEAAARAAKEAEKPFKDAVSKAQSEADKAAEEKKAADTAVEAAQADSDAAAAAEETAAEDVNKAKDAVTAAEGALKKANEEKKNAEKEVAIAQVAKKEADDKQAGAEKELADYQAEAAKKLNSYEFFVWLSNQSDQSEKVRTSADVAARLLKNQLSSTEKAAIKNDGTVSSSSAGKTYEEIIGNTNIGAEGDATSWDNFRYALELAAKGNTYRAKENYPALGISSVMMAMGEANANYQLSLGDMSISHASAFLSLENLALSRDGSGSRQEYPSPVFKSYDPYEGWYTREKEVYDYAVEKGWNPSNLTSEQKNEIKQELGLSSTGYVQTGHYLTLTDRNGGTVMKSTGFGYVNNVSQRYDSPWYWTYSVEKFSQAFGYSRSYEGGSDAISTSAYTALVDKYEASVTEKEDAYKKAVSDAKAEAETARKNLDDADTKVGKAEADITAAEKSVETAKTDLSTKEETLKEKKSESAAKKDALDKAKGDQELRAAEAALADQSLNKAKDALTAAENNTAEAETLVDDAAADVISKEAALNKAEGEKAAAEKALEDAKSSEAEKQEALDTVARQKNAGASAKLDASKRACDDANAAYEKAIEDLGSKEAALAASEQKKLDADAAKLTADKGVIEKVAAVKAAQKDKDAADKVYDTSSELGELKTAKDELNAAKAEAQAAEAKRDAAKVSLDEAQASYDEVLSKNTDVGPGASVEAAEAAIANMTSDNDLPGAVFNKLQLRSKKQTNTSITINWKKVSGAKRYVIYGNKCGKTKKMKRLGSSTGTSRTYKKVLGKKLKKGTYYKFMIIALDKDNNVVSSSKIIHVATKGGKVGNVGKVTTKARKNNVTIKKGKKFKLAGKQVAASKKLKVKKHRAVTYESTKPKVATVSKKGVIKGKRKGTCYVYAYAQNGVFAKIKVTVK